MHQDLPMQTNASCLFQPQAEGHLAHTPQKHAWLALGLAMAVGWTLSGPAAAQAAEPSPHAAAALAALLGPAGQIQQMGNAPPTTTLQAMAATAGSAPSSATFSAAASSPTRASITAQRGETLDRLIRRALPGLPLHPDFLRQAFVQLNPKVFPKGTAHAMRSGTPLVVPSTEDLRQMLASQHPEFLALMAKSEVQPRHPVASEKVEQRRWVRFP
jgi:hypothetical protein